MASLFIIQGRDQGKRFDLQGPVIGIGRDKSNFIQLHDTEVSRRHAELRLDGDDYSLIDLRSSNGSYVNSDKVDRQPLHNGDRLQVGRTLMLFTRVDKQSSIVAAGDVDIVGKQMAEPESRIVSTIGSDEGSRIVGGLEGDGPWLARARSNLQIMYRTALAISHTLDIDQLLHRIMELIFEWVEADRGCVMLIDQESGELQPAVRRNSRRPHSDEVMSISRTILDYVMERKEGVLTSNARDDERWDPGVSIVSMGVREAICVPMQGRYGVVGLIYIDTSTSPGNLIQTGSANKFTNEHLKLMVAIGHQAALAVEDTSYYSALVQAERLAAMGQTIATLSHHIKNILQGIRGGSYLIEEGLKCDDNDVVRKGWGIVDRNQEKISNLVMDMLTFSKEREPDMVSGNINDVAQDVFELMQTRASDAGVELVLEPASNMPILTFDPDALHRAVLNVVTNAIDACEHSPDGTVVLKTELSADGATVNMIVADNGEGIPADDIKKIFSVFESRKGSRGTGLGLPVSEKIMREHGGGIAVESTPKRGSRFTLHFPALRPPETGESLGVTQEMRPS